MALKLEQTTAKDLNTRAVKNSDNLPLDAEFFNLCFEFLTSEELFRRAGVVVTITDEAREILERESKMSFDVNASVYRAVHVYPNGYGVHVLLGGMSTASGIEQQLFDVIAVRTRNNQLELWNDSPFIGGKQIGEYQTAEQVNAIMVAARDYTSP